MHNSKRFMTREREISFNHVPTMSFNHLLQVGKMRIQNFAIKFVNA